MTNQRLSNRQIATLKHLAVCCPPADIHRAMKRNPDGTPASPLGRAAAYLVEGER